MAHIKGVSKESDDTRVTLKEELKVEMQVGEAWVLAQLESVRAIVEHPVVPLSSFLQSLLTQFQILLLLHLLVMKQLTYLNFILFSCISCHTIYISG